MFFIALRRVETRHKTPDMYAYRHESLNRYFDTLKPSGYFVCYQV
jgi:hypothetical protein